MNAGQIEILRVWDKDLEFSKPLIEKLVSVRDFYFVSFCPYKRLWAQRRGVKRVLNPYQFHHWPEINGSLIWWDEWPSFLGRKWQQVRFHLLCGHNQHLFHQSFRLKYEDLILKRLFGEDYFFGTVLNAKKLNFLGVVSHPYKVFLRYVGEEFRGLLLKDPKLWPQGFGREVFVPHDLRDCSEVLAFHYRHRILLTSLMIPRSWGLLQRLKMLSFDDEVLCWFLSGRPEGDLLKWWNENQSRRYPHPQGALSRAACHWHSSFKKWAIALCSLLWRSRRGKEAQGLDSRDWLHDEDGALSHPFHQRAA